MQGGEVDARTDVLLILERCINNLSGTDGRPMISKTPSVTGRHNRPFVLSHVSFSSYPSLFIQERIFQVTSTAVAEVEHIPTINSNADAGNSGGDSLAGVLIDYQIYAGFYHTAIKVNHINADPRLPFNHVWLRTSDAPTAVTHVRVALQTCDLRLDNLYDRRALSNVLRTDSLYLGLVAFLTLGTITALLLVVLGTDWRRG